MKKLVLGLATCALALTAFMGATSEGAYSHGLNAKMNSLEKTVASTLVATEDDLAFDKNKTLAVQAMPYGTGYTNVNSYGFPAFGYGGMGMYNNGWGWGMNPYMPYGYNVGAYGMMPGMGGQGGTGRFRSNIDTYRINAIHENGKTTIDTFHNHEPVEHEVIESEGSESEESATSNLEKSFVFCTISSNYGEFLKDEILGAIEKVKQSISALGQDEKADLQEEKANVNELMGNILMSMASLEEGRADMQKNIEDVKRGKSSYEESPRAVNAKYMRLLSATDTQNTHLESILASILEVDDCLGGKCNGFCLKGAKDNFAWVNGCPDGACPDCNDCTNCRTSQACRNSQALTGCRGCVDCNNCLLCTDCTGCTDCINCEDCVNCSNLANAKGYRNNMPVVKADNDHETTADNGTERNETSPEQNNKLESALNDNREDTLGNGAQRENKSDGLNGTANAGAAPTQNSQAKQVQMPSTGVARVENGQASHTTNHIKPMQPAAVNNSQKAQANVAENKEKVATTQAAAPKHVPASEMAKPDNKKAPAEKTLATADEIVADNLIEHKRANNGKDKEMNDVFASEKAKPVKEFTIKDNNKAKTDNAEQNGVFNQNPRENNKGLTA